MHIRGFNVVKVNRKFGLIDKLAYMSGDLANDLSFMFVMMYLMVFYTKVLGVSGAVVGILFLIARVVDAFTDIGMGRIVDVISPKKEGKILRNTPMDRFGEPEEMLGAIEFLVDNEKASFVTGIIIPIDGGFSAYSGV